MPATIPKAKARHLPRLALYSAFVPPSDMKRLTTDDIETHLAVWLATAGGDRAAMIRDLWTRKDEPNDLAKREAARRALAVYLVGKITMARWEVTRPPVVLDRGR